MISVAQNNLCLHIFDELLLAYCFYTAYRAHRHKDGSEYFAMIRCDLPGSCFGILVGMLQLKCKCCHKKIRPAKSERDANINFIIHSPAKDASAV